MNNIKQKIWIYLILVQLYFLYFNKFVNKDFGGFKMYDDLNIKINEDKQSEDLLKKIFKKRSKRKNILGRIFQSTIF